MNNFFKDTPNIKRKETVWWSECLSQKPSENPETYICRAMSDISSHSIIELGLGGKKETSDPDWKKIKPLLFENAKKIFGKIPVQMEIRDLNGQLEKLSEGISPMLNQIDGDPLNQANYFAKTVSNRKFQSGNTYDKIPIYKQLFHLGGLSKEQAEEIIAERLNGQNLILLGGGKSLNDFIKVNNFKTTAVINIDPFLNSEKISKNLNKNYRSLPLRADDHNLIDENIPKANEIWATYSVPLYLEKTTEISQLFKNIDYLLAPGGILRVYPLSLLRFSDKEEKIFKEAESFTQRKTAWIEAIIELLRTGQYNLNIVGDTMCLQKLAN